MLFMKRVIAIFLLLLVSSIWHSSPLEYSQILREKWVNIIESPYVETSFPGWMKPGYNQDIEHWLRVLPFPGDRNESAYIVIPRVGIVAPIKKQLWVLDIESDFDYLSLLESGLALYPNHNHGLASWWNSVVFWHSSYPTRQAGRYKTIFSVLPILDKWDQIWVYKKEFWKFKLYKYHILHSYETHPYDGFVTQSSTRKLLTLFTCTDIGTTDNRWLIKAEQIEWDVYTPYDHAAAKKKSIQHKVTVPSSSQSMTQQEVFESIFDTIE